MANESNSQHISQRYDAELDAVKNRLAEMGGIVEKQVGDAIHTLLEADSDLALKVIEKDKR